jgi:hypothetical protein
MKTLPLITLIKLMKADKNPVKESHLHQLA